MTQLTPFPHHTHDFQALRPLPLKTSFTLFHSFSIQMDHQSRVKLERNSSEEDNLRIRTDTAVCKKRKIKQEDETQEPMKQEFEAKGEKQRNERGRPRGTLSEEDKLRIRTDTAVCKKRKIKEECKTQESKEEVKPKSRTERARPTSQDNLRKTAVRKTRESTQEEPTPRPKRRIGETMKMRKRRRQLLLQRRRSRLTNTTDSERKTTRTTQHALRMETFRRQVLLRSAAVVVAGKNKKPETCLTVERRRREEIGLGGRIGKWTVRERERYEAVKRSKIGSWRAWRFLQNLVDEGVGKDIGLLI